MNTVVSVFGIEPCRIGGAERYARELSVQLGERGWLSVLCFLKEPPERVRSYLQLPNVRIEVIEDSWRTRWRAVTGMSRVLRKYRPEILHLHFTGFIGPYPWLAKLCRAKPDVHFAFVGEGAYRERYTNQTAELGLEGNVTWTGQIDDPMAEGVFAAADVVCQVSRWEEVFGYVIAEAMSCGKPLGATRVGGIPELVQDGTTGFVVDRGDVRAIADRILELAADRELRECMGRTGRHAVESKFDLERNVARVMEAYGISAPTAAEAVRESLVSVS